MTGVASFISLADIGYQCPRTLQLNFEGGDQRVFGVNDNVFRFPLKFKANRKLHLRALLISVKSSTILSKGRLGARHLQAPEHQSRGAAQCRPWRFARLPICVN
jgi:hypothetical protein